MEAVVSIPDMLRDLAEARREKADLACELKEAKQLWEREHADMIAAASGCSATVTAMEAALKAAIVAHYNTDPGKNKKPFAGVGIRVSTKTTFAYDADEALAWAKQHDMCLALDRTAFETVAGTIKAEWLSATESEDVSATIATDLDKALAEVSR